ncbi:Conserved_hypothetical protein [Hexamita inflata]|uniref:Transmembrane protein n=1 Tax=Hexamita inflata TaxID=28002 RepID=A0AA86US48_9EUKA|nr:Conserved hypothetical protein [Hexamita inflata]
MLKIEKSVVTTLNQQITGIFQSQKYILVSTSSELQLYDMEVNLRQQTQHNVLSIAQTAYNNMFLVLTNKSLIVVKIKVKSMQIVEVSRIELTKQVSAMYGFLTHFILCADSELIYFYFESQERLIQLVASTSIDFPITNIVKISDEYKTEFFLLSKRGNYVLLPPFQLKADGQSLFCESTEEKLIQLDSRIKLLNVIQPDLEKQDFIGLTPSSVLRLTYQLEETSAVCPSDAIFYVQNKLFCAQNNTLTINTLEQKLKLVKKIQTDLRIERVHVDSDIMNVVVAGKSEFQSIKVRNVNYQKPMAYVLLSICLLVLSAWISYLRKVNEVK